MKSIYPQIHLTDHRFKYTSSAKTDISVTFERVKQDLKFSELISNQRKPLVSPPLNPNGFVLSADWFDLV
jgi:hypothetical protein